jgi:dipeptidyl aminopeptidase/acylaminoacyl peptidase
MHLPALLPLLPMLAAGLVGAAAPAPLPAPLPLLPVAGAPGLSGSGLPALPPALGELVRRWGNSREARLFDVTTDGAQLLIGTRFGATRQLHLVEQPQGTRTQLTFGEEPVAAARFLPQDPAVIFYLQDIGGAELYQLFRLDRRTQRVERLTDGASRNDALVLSRDGRRLAWASTGRNGRDTDVLLADSSAAAAPRRLTEEEGTWRPLDFAPGGRQLLVLQERSAQDGELWSIDLETRAKTRLTPAEGRASLRGALFAADGHAVFAITDRWGERNELVRIDLQQPQAQPRRLTQGLPFEVEAIAAPGDAGAPAQLAVSVNQEGTDRLYLVEPGTGALQPIALPPGLLTGLRFPSARGDQLFFAEEHAQSPADVWQLDLRTKRVQRWTRSELGPIDPARLVAPTLVRIPSAGGPVPAFLYRPRPSDDGQPPRRLPVVVIWHGGPESQARPIFSPTIQLLASELGLAVLAPNVRGSSGYGKAWLAADDGALRERALADVGAVFDWIAAQPDLDPARVGIQGGSYGGYLALVCAAFHPERVRAVIDVVGISNLVTFLERTKAWRRDLRRAEYGNERDPAVRAVLERISPLNAAGRIRAPLLVIQGKNDPRVPESEAEQIVAAVRAAGGRAGYLLSDSAGHGLQRKEERDLQLWISLAFWQQELLGR